MKNNFMKKIFTRVALTILVVQTLSASSFAKECKIVINKNDVLVNWTAFKTPAKVGVGGQFRNLGIPETISASNFKEIFNTTNFNIDSASVYTRNSGRDAKIVKYFFQPMMGGLDIKGSFQYESEESLTLKIKMNGVEQKVPLKLTTTENSVEAKGILDVFDFSMKKSLTGINQACFDLHQGKTWNDVEIGFSFKYTKNCN